VAQFRQIPARRLGAVAACVLLAGAAAGCGATARLAGGRQVIDVTERDFTIKASPKRVSPGQVVFQARNRGPDAHELIVVRASDGGLKLRSDGMTVSEEGLKAAVVGTLEPGAPGSVRELRARLAPGRYVLICNMSGHYMGGMHTVVTVR
jgi:uncharacterized cupredoxin-like copper-binding protein